MRGAWLHGLQFKAEGQETFTVKHYLQLGSPAICMRVLAYADKRLTIQMICIYIDIYIYRPKKATNIPIWAGIVDGAKLF